jgi:hypothetical protein
MIWIITMSCMLEAGRSARSKFSTLTSHYTFTLSEGFVALKRETSLFENRYPWFVAGGGSPGSVFETIPHDLHRLRRSAINHFFSNRSITAIEPMIKTKVSQLSDIFHSHMTSKTPVNLRVMFSALTLDIISDYCYGESFGALNDQNVAREWYYTLEAVMAKAPLFMHFPWLLKVMGLLPDSIAGPVLRHHRVSVHCILSIQILDH